MAPASRPGSHRPRSPEPACFLAIHADGPTGSLALREHEYKRNGTQCLFAALKASEVEVLMMPSKTRNRFDLIRFLDMLDEQLPVVEGQPIVAISDNLSTRAVGAAVALGLGQVAAVYIWRRHPWRGHDRQPQPAGAMSAPVEDQYGLMTDMYTPKPAFSVCHAFMSAL